MIVDLNIIQEICTITLVPGDATAPHEVQSRLDEMNIPFITFDSHGVWHVKTTYILRLYESLAYFGADWTAKAQGRATIVQQDLSVQEGTPFPYFSRGGHGLTTVDSLLRSPFNEQAEAATYMSAPGVRRFALFWKPGTGKTGAFICAANELLTRGVIKGVLVVAERPIAIEDPWYAEINAWLPPGNLGLNSVAKVSGTIAERLAIYSSNPIWLILHYGLLERDQDAIRGWALRNTAEEAPVVIFDESDMIKNPLANRSRSAMNARQSCGRCWIASGTPAPNSPADYEHQLSVLCGYPVDFRLTGDRREDALVVIHELEKGVYYLQQDNPRKMPETMIPLRVPLTESQRESYNRMAGDLVNDLTAMDDVRFVQEKFSIMARRAKLLRLCSDPSHESLEDIDFNDPAKVIKIDDLLEEILCSRDEKVIIWTRFVGTARNMFDRYQDKWGASLLIGGEGTPADLEREECRLMIATIGRGASSISLTPARNAIYESLDDISRNFAQSMARINRTGQERDCRYWVLISEDTIEEDQYAAIMGKIDLSEETLDEIGIPGRAQLIEQLKRTISSNS